jgi:HSP20 family protein
MNRRTADIFSQFELIHERIDQARRQVIGPPGGPRFCVPYMEPAIDVYETDGEVVVVVEIAGISGQEVTLELAGRTLLLKGERRPLPGRPQRLYSQMEICHGAFQRELQLPADVDAEKAQTAYGEGILEVVLPKAGQPVSRHLRIVVR